jgi:predicted nucleic acid-binding protein
MERNHGRRRPHLTNSIVLDTGALIALERGDRRVRHHIVNAGENGFKAVVPILVVMEALAGARDHARLNRLLAVIDDELPLLVPMGRQIPGLRARATQASDADASVVLEALARPGSVIMTGDARDIGALLEAAGAAGRVPILRV